MNSALDEGFSNPFPTLPGLQLLFPDHSFALGFVKFYMNNIPWTVACRESFFSPRIVKAESPDQIGGKADVKDVAGLGVQYIDCIHEKRAIVVKALFSKFKFYCGARGRFELPTALGGYESCLE